MRHEPLPGQLFQHTDGGIYRFVMKAKDTRDLTPMFVYLHQWPFDVSAEGWARPASEWLSRFTPVTEADLERARAGDRLAAQQRISALRAARKATKA